MRGVVRARVLAAGVAAVTAGGVLVTLPACFSNPCAGGACETSDAAPFADGDLGACQTSGDDEPRIVALAAGPSFTCARAEDGRIWCWGESRAGQLGTREVTHSEWPREILAPEGAAWETFAVGATHGCGIYGDLGKVACWGDNAAGQRGVMSVGDRPGAVALDDPCCSTDGALINGDYLSIAAADRHSCATTTTSIMCWGENNRGQLGEPVVNDGRTCQNGACGIPHEVQLGSVAIGRITKVAAAGEHTCMALEPVGGENDVDVLCAGSNDHGESAPLNDGESEVMAFRPVVTAAPVHTEAVLGPTRSSALTPEGAVARLWGLGTDKLALQDAAAVTGPGAVWVTLSHGATASCAVIRSGEDFGVYCGGDADDPVLAPAEPCGVGFSAACEAKGWPAGQRVEDIAVGAAHACALVAGRVWCWGSNELDGGAVGVLGPCTRDAARPRTAPVRVPF